MTQYQEKIVGKPGGLVEPGVKQYGFLKKIFKPVKKIAKKVWKSPLGKAALIGGGLYSLGGLESLGGQGMFARGQGLQRFRNLGSMFGSKGVLGDILYSGKGADRKFSLGKAGLTALLGAGVTMPFLGGDDEEDIVEEGWENTPASIASIRNMARNRDPSLNFLPSNAYAQSGFYAADGGLASLANGGGVAEAKAEQMLKMEYQKYRNQGGTMSYQRFKMMVLQQAQGQGPGAQGQPQMAPQMAADGGRIGYGSGTAYPNPNRVTPKGDLATNMMNVFANKFGGRKIATPGRPVATSKSFMGSMIPSTFQGQDGDYQAYLASGSELPYQAWKASRVTAAQGGRIGYQRGGPPGGGDPGMRGTGQSYGSSYGPGRDTGWSPGVGGTQHIPTHRPTVAPDRGNENTDRVNTIINNVSAGNKLKNFATTGNPVDLLKINPMLLGGSMVWNKFKNQDDEASLPSGYDFSGIQDHRAEVLQKDIDASKMKGFSAMDYPSYKDQMNTYQGGTTVTPFEFKGLQEGTITEPGTYVGAEGGRVGRAEGGIMDLGGVEKDYRQEGGFVPLGKKEKADDVPARLSKNEFVFTADAVRNAGGGDIDAGAEVMQNMMDNLEQGGQISEESQGAQGMYNQQQMLQSRMA